ncbi:MAG: tryptophan--tRNA ligase [Candidatus Woesearchaeota archaeon]
MGTVTPWEVTGKIDYEKIIKDFGVSPIEELPEQFNDLLFRRKKIFAHRDFDRVLSAIREKKPFIMMTGLMPSGKFHIGHMILAKQMLFYQKLGAKVYITVADIEAYNARGQSLEESRKIAIEEYLLNYAALGLDLEKCNIYFQSNRSSDPKIANAYYRLQNILARHVTFNEFRAVYGEISPGKMTSALIQASDMLHPQLPELEGPMPVVVPVGIDQDPHIRLARDITQRVKSYNFVQLSSTYHLFVPGLSGDKMSSSDPTSYIALTDDEKTVRKKVNKYAFSGGQDTVEKHREKGGDPDIDIAFQWLTFLEEDDETLKKVRDDYRAGTLLSGELKAKLIDKLNDFLQYHQAARKKVQDMVTEFAREL